jgi:MFS family permease
MHSALAPTYRTTRHGRRALWRTAEGALVVGIAAAIFLTFLWFASPSSSEGGSYDDAADYLFTGNGVPFAAAALVLLWALLKLHGDRVGRRARIGVAIASVSLVALMAVLAASVAAGHEVEGGPTYILGTLGSIVGIILFCADAARAGLLPARALWFWALAWTVGGMLGPKGSQVLLAIAYTVLLLHVHRRARDDVAWAD